MEEGKLLGKKIEYPGKYCPEILVPVPRSQNREIYNICEPDKLFHGYDCWHAYEAGFITNNGMPVVGLLKIVYPATSRCIVESKSLKLYLGSFSMVQYGNTPEEGINHFVSTVKTDLSKLLSTEVDICFHRTLPEHTAFDFQQYRVMENNPELNSTIFSVYQEYPDLLRENISTKIKEIKVCSHLLKSNCKITNQPDWGSIYIHLKANYTPSETGILKYIVSLRNENHFHEEICEMTYKRLWDLFQPEILSVTCLYTRRGGIDICPSRANKPEYLPLYLPQAEIQTERGFRQ